MARQQSRRWGPRWRGTVSKSSSGWGCGPRHEIPPEVTLEGMRDKAQRFGVVLVRNNGSVDRSRFFCQDRFYLPGQIRDAMHA